MQQGLGDKTTVFCKFLPNERYYMLRKFYRFLAVNVVVIYILVFVYYGSYEIPFFLLLYVYLQNGKNNKKKKKEKKKLPITITRFATLLGNNGKMTAGYKLIRCLIRNS